MTAVSGFDLFGGGGVKSVQHGTVSGTSPINVNINPVNPNTSIAFCYVKATESQLQFEMYTAKIIDSTTLVLQKGNPLSSRDLSWTVIEFKELNSLQVIEQASTTAITDIPITPVDLSKSFILVSFRSTAASVGTAAQVNGKVYFLNDSTVRAEYSAGIQRTFLIQVVEFK